MHTNHKHARWVLLRIEHRRQRLPHVALNVNQWYRHFARAACIGSQHIRGRCSCRVLLGNRNRGNNRPIRAIALASPGDWTRRISRRTTARLAVPKGCEGIPDVGEGGRTKFVEDNRATHPAICKEQCTEGSVRATDVVYYRLALGETVRLLEEGHVLTKLLLTGFGGRSRSQRPVDFGLEIISRNTQAHWLVRLASSSTRIANIGLLYLKMASSRGCAPLYARKLNTRLGTSRRRHLF
eukprot:scaffold40981_cov28-Tisochrysis_lutea.AAC.2